MKKITTILIAAMTMICLALPQEAYAFGKGEKSLGVNGGYAGYNEGGYMSVSFNWEFANHFRLAPDIGYAFRNQGKSAFFFDIDMQFPFKLVRGFGIYPLAGLTVNNWHYSGTNSSTTRAGGNVGLGFDIYFTSYLKLNVQGKYSIMDDLSGCFIGMGVSYVF